MREPAYVLSARETGLWVQGICVMRTVCDGHVGSRYLVPNGASVVSGQGFAEVEVMKM